MSLFGKLFDEVEHDAKPLLSAAAKWAETEGLKIVRQVEAEIKSKGPAEIAALFYATVGRDMGFSIPAETILPAEAIDLMITALARKAAQTSSGASLRPAVLNTGIEQAVLLAKGQTGDTDPKASAVTQTV